MVICAKHFIFKLNWNEIDDVMGGKTFLKIIKIQRQYACSNKKC